MGGKSLGLAILLFIFGVLTDFWDGWYARRHRLETPVGRILDPTADKIFILVCFATFSAQGLYSHWVLVPIFLREVAVTFCRLVWLFQGRAVGAEKAGKIKFGFQVASASFSFIYLLHPGPQTQRLNFLFLGVALALTVYSGILFFLNNREGLRDQRFLKAVSTLGVGNLKPVPGTYGTLLGLLVVPLVAFDPLLHALVFFSFIALTYAVIPRLGLGEHEDPLEIVIDEFCGILLAFFAVPVTLASLAVGFLLFRIFDVTKLFPINWLEKQKGVNGILWDDLGAGVYTWLILRFVFT